MRLTSAASCSLAHTARCTRISAASCIPPCFSWKFGLVPFLLLGLGILRRIVPRNAVGIVDIFTPRCFILEHIIAAAATPCKLMEVHGGCVVMIIIRESASGRNRTRSLTLVLSSSSKVLFNEPASAPVERSWAIGYLAAAYHQQQF